LKEALMQSGNHKGKQVVIRDGANRTLKTELMISAEEKEEIRN